jgi:hypothetical protein
MRQIGMAAIGNAANRQGGNRQGGKSAWRQSAMRQIGKAAIGNAANRHGGNRQCGKSARRQSAMRQIGKAAIGNAANRHGGNRQIEAVHKNSTLSNTIEINYRPPWNQLVTFWLTCTNIISILSSLDPDDHILVDLVTHYFNFVPLDPAIQKSESIRKSHTLVPVN